MFLWITNTNKKVKSKFYIQEEKKFLNRLNKYKNNHLLFISNFDIPFDNNLLERELRHVKSKKFQAILKVWREYKINQI